MGMTIVIIVINVNLFGKGGFFVTRHFWVPRTAYKISPRVRRIRRALDWVLICHFCWARRNTAECVAYPYHVADCGARKHLDHLNFKPKFLC
jgi:hypothetical protein